jgi:predicted lactoylglutathione lyase
MAQDIWLNLPVKDLATSVSFFTAIGFARNPGPGNSEHSASFTIGDRKVVLMLFTQDAFAGFTRNAVANTAQGTEVLFSLGADSRGQVDDVAKRAKAARGSVFAQPQEFGFMYGCGFCDPDGHRWNMLYMDPAQMPK